MKSYAAQDKHASYVIELDNNTVIARVQGAFCESLIKRFCEDIQEMVKQFDPSFVWAYFGFMPDCDGYTGECEKLLVENSVFAKNHGCLVDAYTINSPVARSQIEQARLKAGIDSPLEKHLFEDEEEALAFIAHHYQQLQVACPPARLT